MIVGFNHNIAYRGEVFHVQTEDSGPKKPTLVTLLYHGGSIISSHKTAYDDILKVDNLQQVVEELAKDQHKGMLKRLTRGEFDKRIIALGIAIDTTGIVPPQQQEREVPAPSAQPAQQSAKKAPADSFAGTAREPDGVEEVLLDDLDRLVYAYLTATPKS